MNINARIKTLRNKLKLTQVEFGQRISIAQSYLASIENGKRDVTEKILRLICFEFNVSEDWLRYGQGEMFVQPDEFSLDEYAEKSHLSELELDIIKGYMNLDSNVRKEVMSYLKSIFDKHSEVAATKEEDYIESELEKYRLELEAEAKGATSSASENLKEKSN